MMGPATGAGSSTVTVLVMVVQPPELQVLRVTVFCPGVEKMTERFCEVEVEGSCEVEVPVRREGRANARARVAEIVID
jgi:hypothetical protein